MKSMITHSRGGNYEHAEFKREVEKDRESLPRSNLGDKNGVLYKT